MGLGTLKARWESVSLLHDNRVLYTGSDDQQSSEHLNLQGRLFAAFKSNMKVSIPSKWVKGSIC